MRTRMLAVAGAAIVALAGCDSGGPAAAPSASAGGASREAYVAAAECMRANGFPDFPDPVETNGHWGFPASVNDLVKQPAGECQDQFARIGAIPARTQRVVSADEMTKLRKWGDCIRRNGLPNWPDPDSEGTFHVDSPPGADDPAWRKADDACRSLEPGPIQVEAGPGSRASKAAGG
ncbi:hypothetical protein ACPPVO_25905 [Dactylosporangium sp. McL0621]|uniref:hypothetical protein n=1 Tax=Dactylosporangium sp. McL0621 TaxID=3415678 RepID=UPI003CF87695